ncbi:Crp/Fnr family transcriptional regulator [Nostoc sp. 106C]|uniref:Crp/Fnr family transcriptional regulator n=1 Tax=Nostoc sp. 106C TaxID=1932667 RepID=UPI000A3B4B5A|nr:Crp/Fnr family transcriptional regulator [Nostoc sp. 106C]OUL31195.1 Crp/Fnr family transcriptional regulator [Nostoc sp. 106C]
MLVNKTPTIMRENRLLAALPAYEYERLVPHLKFVALSSGEFLYEPEEPITQIYFPNNSVVSVIITTENGSTVEVGLVGNEGMVGIPVILGGNTTTTSGIVKIPGSAMQMNADIVKIEFERGGLLQKLLLRYVQALHAQVSQAAVCNRLHTLEARLARWLLTVSDRIQSDELPLTQEYISHMLGVRRSGVTVAAGTLSEQGIISYHRGHITILNREGLEATSCECYRIIKYELARLLGN